MFAIKRTVRGAVRKCSGVVSSRCLQLWCLHGPPEPLPDSLAGQVTKVTRGVDFTVLYSSASPSLWFWGENPPISGTRRERVSLPGQQLVKQVSVGRRHVVAVTTTGEVYAMGLNCFGQCGVSTHTEQLLSLQQVKELRHVSKVCCGLDHTHFLSTEGLLYSCGWSDDGQTGTGCRGALATPHQVRGELETERVRDVYSRADSSVAITDSHTLYAWGNNEYQQLPIHSEDMQVFEPCRIIVPIPNQSDDHTVVATAIGSSFSAVLDGDGKVYHSGCLGGSQIERGERWRLLYDPARQGGGREVVDMRAGLHYLAAAVVTETGRSHLLLWGSHQHTHTDSSPLPCPIHTDSSHLPHPIQVDLPSALMDWDAGPLDVCLLMK